MNLWFKQNRIVGLLAVIACLLSVTPPVEAQQEAAVLQISAEFLKSDMLTPPPDSGDWREVMLPDRDSLNEIAPDALGWYRIAITAPPASSENLAIYLWRYGMNAAVYLNDHLLGDGGPITNDRIRSTHIPLLFVLPPGSFDADENYIYILLKGVGGFARLMPPVLGDYEQLRVSYDQRVFMQQTLPTVFLVVVVLVGSLALIFSAGDVTKRGYRFLGLACVAWLPYSLNPIIHEVPISMDFWRWSMHTGIDAFGISLIFFAHRLVGLHRPRLEFFLVCALLLLSTAYALWTDATFGRYATRAHILTVMLGCYTTWVLFRSYRRTSDYSSLVFMLGILLLLPLALHDVLFSSLPLETTWTYSFLASNLGAPALFLALGADLTWSVYRSNTRLSEALELERSALAERSRIYRDVHDDVGARLLSLIYNAENEKQENTARSALDDMRAAIQNNTQPIDIPSFLQAWRTEIEQRFGEAGIDLEWQSDATGGTLNAEVRYQLTKVLRELINNVLRHSQAKQVKVLAQFDADAQQLDIALQDDGIGFETSAQTSGTGLSSILQRLYRIDGLIEWKMDGRLAQLSLPVGPRSS